jgi:hypothetical protein
MFANVTNVDENIASLVRRNYRPDTPTKSLDGSAIEEHYERMMRQCWQHRPQDCITMLNTLAYFQVDIHSALDFAPNCIAVSRRSCKSRGSNKKST